MFEGWASDRIVKAGLVQWWLEFGPWTAIRGRL